MPAAYLPNSIFETPSLEDPTGTADVFQPSPDACPLPALMITVD
jgi:hypothetical protein